MPMRRRAMRPRMPKRRCRTTRSWHSSSFSATVKALDQMDLSRSVAGEMKKLGQHSSHYLAGLFRGVVIGCISFPIFTRIFSLPDSGMIDFIQKILLVPTALSKAGMQNSVLRFYNEKEFSSNRQSARSYYSTMLFGVAAMAVAITLIFLIAVKLLLRHLIDGPLATLLCFASA